MSGSLGGFGGDHHSSVQAGSSGGVPITEQPRPGLFLASPFRRDYIQTLVDYEARSSDLEVVFPAIESDKAAKMMERRKQRAHNELFASVGEELDSNRP